jgi:hypothetical protein
MEDGDYVAHQGSILKTQQPVKVLFRYTVEPSIFVKIFEFRLVSESLLDKE